MSKIEEAAIKAEELMNSKYGDAWKIINISETGEERIEINSQLLAYGNLYRHTEKNNKPEAKAGFFEDNGRVKAIKLRGIVSEGFLME